ncbi:MAG: DUF481 domain-containing protein [Pirellulales bacterium]|nr:DUF481 domain-containing protein [Thermoguttaceae bacterium]MDD4787023.1 DUF481 domain-containing protein [Pirellulales bacterium]MDI9443938.1 DUF481 domain-containing protein [Planctomycetota bacterium]NLZ02412.1 DUF481 domain-containing protein [Pirellulaceae bacterium]
MVRAGLLSALVIGCLATWGFGQDYFTEAYQNPAMNVEPMPPAYSTAPSASPYAMQMAPQPLSLPNDPTSAPFGPPEILPETVPAPSADQAAGGSSDTPVLADPIQVAEPAPWWMYDMGDWLDFWTGSLELGVTGSEGNSQTLNYQLGVDAKRKTKQTVLDFDLQYYRKSADSIETSHRLFAETRWEWLFADSPWTWYVRQLTEYDEFTAYDVRLTFDTGLGYALIDNETTSFVTRAGAGGSREIGGPDDSWVPEAVFGLEFSHQLSKRQKLSASADYTPDVTNFSDYRLTSKAAWEVLLDEEMNLSLKLSILDRYDSTPNGVKPNDLDYTITLLWKF